MPPKYFVEIGRVALIHFGPCAGRLCTIIDVIDQNRALIDGPNSSVPRQAIPFKKLRLTKFKIRIPHGTSSKTIAKAWDKDEITKKWAETKMCKRLEMRKLKREMNDFDRFKLYKVKQRMNTIIKRKFLTLKAKRTKEKKSKVTKVPKVPKVPKQKTAKKEEKKK